MNENRQHFSEEILNAYIDGELGANDSARIARAADTDDILRRRLSELRRVKNLVRDAFEDVPQSKSEPLDSRQAPVSSYWRIAAVAAFMGLGATLGWHVYEHHSGHIGTGAMTVAATHRAAPESATSSPNRQPLDGAAGVMFHIGHNDELLLGKVLDETDRLLSAPKNNDYLIKVRIVASHDGLRFFQSSFNLWGERVRALKSKHPTRVDFVGCGETLNQMRNETPDTKVQLFPEMKVVDSGVLELLRSQRQGWTFVYI